jgi:hypothetical protein
MLAASRRQRTDAAISQIDYPDYDATGMAITTAPRGACVTPSHSALHRSRREHPASRATDAFLKTTYPALYAKGTHTVVKPGDMIAFAGVTTRIVASAGQVIARPLPGAGKSNPSCNIPRRPTQPIPEDTQSVTTHFTFGKFRALHPGDLTIDKEFDLMCPTNRVGTVDVLVGPHHGQDTSNSEAFVHALQPRIIVMNNGTRKGGWPDVMRSFYTSPRFEDLWQMHFSLLSGQEYAPAGVFTANVVGRAAQCAARLRRCPRQARTRRPHLFTTAVHTG